MLLKTKLMELLVIVILLCISVEIVNSQGSSCKGGTKVGPDDPGKLNKNIDKDKATGYLIYDDNYVVKCCGTVKSWEFSIGKGDSVDLQIWRPKDNKNKEYTLVGSNSYKVSKKDKKTSSASYDVSGKDVISVEQNDVIGWYCEDDPVIEYDDDNKGGDNIWQLGSKSSPKIGDVVDFSKGTKQSKRAYGVQITLQPNTPPKLDLLLATSIPMHAEIGTVAYTVHVHDDDPGDGDDLKLEMLTKNEFFAFDPKSGKLTVGADITVPKEGQKYTFDFKVTDHCGESDTGTLTVNVDYAEKQTFPPKNGGSATTVSKKPDNTETSAATTKKDDKKSDDDKAPADNTADKNDVADTADDAGSNKDGKGDDATSNDDGGDADDGKGGKNKKKGDEPESTTTSTTYLPEFEDFTEPSNATAIGTRRKSANIGLIAGIILGVLALMILIATTVAIVMQKRAKAKAKVASKDVEKRAREAYAKSKGKPTPKNSVKPSSKSDDKDKSSTKDNEKKGDKDSKSNTSKEKSSSKGNDHKKTTNDKHSDKKSHQSKSDSKPLMNGKSSK